MKYLLFLYCLLVCVSLAAQQDEHPYLFRQEIDDLLKTDTTPWKFQFAADRYSRIGGYGGLLALADMQYKNVKQRPALSTKDSLYVKSFHPIPAKEYIIQRAAKEKIIIINEAHHQPLHRTFTTSLLQGLYNQGYRYFGIEAVGYDDQDLNKRKYPLLTTGYYTKEPQFGNLVREALRIGFTIFPYETTENHNGKEREIDQAKNIAAFMEKHPGKYLIHCGYAHAIEGPYAAWEKAMAGRLKEYTGIDPLTINQESLTERSMLRFEGPDYEYIRFDQPAVLLDKEGRLYNGVERDSSYDIRLYHPRTQFVNWRPDWLSENGNRTSYFPDTSKITLDLSVLILAYVAGEPVDQAVPYDIIETGQFERPLMLQKGSYVLIIQDRNRKTQQILVTIP